MISFDIGNTCFQVRAAAVIEHRGAVLLHRALQDDFWALPGGRVETGEQASATIVREMQEELNELVRCGELLCVAENFFDYSGKRYHEIGLYFLAHLAPGSRLTAQAGPFIGSDGETKLEFAWFERSRLMNVDVRPAFLRQSLSRSKFTFEHVIQQDSGTSRGNADRP